jgi:hypothetical protein
MLGCFPREYSKRTLFRRCSLPKASRLLTNWLFVDLSEKHIILMKPHDYGEEEFLGSPSPITVGVDGHVSCRLYRDTRPHFLEIAQLQKGLVLMTDGRELIEEGVGFGAPVVQYEDCTYFSSSAEVSVEKEGNHEVLVKSFVLDAVSRKRVGKAFLNDYFYDFIHRPFDAIYMHNKRLKPVFNKIVELVKVLGVNTEFVKVKPRGVITVRYTCLSGSVEVAVSLAQLNKFGCKEILILNEQGAAFFRKYADSDGLVLINGQVGVWELVKAEEASFSNANGKVAFSLRNVEGSVFFRGREKIQNRCSWVGLGYSLHPRLKFFRYVIKLRHSVLS